MTEHKPWERLDGETGKAWEAFVKYRDAGPSRTFTKVADELKKSVQLLSRWGKQYDWAERVLAWDREYDRLWRDRMVRERPHVDQRHAAIAQQFQGKVLRRLKTLHPEGLSAAEVRKWTEVAVKIERAVYGLGETEEERAGGVVQIVVDPRWMPGPTSTPDALS